MITKDWTGNKKSTYATLGASNRSAHDREIHDYYATEPSAIDDLFNVEDFASIIWEPACGEGHLSIRMASFGKEVFSSDLIDRGFGKPGVDFLMAAEVFAGDIITNPPYKFAAEFVEQALKLTSNKVAMFLKLTFLEGQGRQKLFIKYPPKKIWVYSFRKKCAMNGRFSDTGSSASCYAWFVWEKGFSGAPTLGWLNPIEYVKQKVTVDDL